MTFEELNLHSEVIEGIKAAGYSGCMPVQERVLPVSLQGNDVMVQSKTGSGKTAVFIITFLEQYLIAREMGLQCSCLIVAPTRELAHQIADDAKLLCSGVQGFKVGCFYGGVGYESQRKMLEKGCDIYVGTPGRLIDFLRNNELDGKKIDCFVIDEADRLFDMGFYPDIQRMFTFLREKDDRQTMLFSATLDIKVIDLAWQYMNEPYQIDLEGDSVTVEEITQELYHVAKSDKFGLFLQLLEREKPQAALVFTNSRLMAGEVSRRLKENNWKADHLSGEMSQVLRDKALKSLKDGKVTILVATDVAARGLQIDDLPLVINYDLPEDYENYVHRIGRTARAGKKGKAISLADEEFVYALESIEKFIKMKIPVVWPDNLPDVEDLSLECRNTRKPLKDNKQNKESVKPDKPLGSMSEEERIEYYKRKYGFIPVSGKATENGNKTAIKNTRKSEGKKIQLTVKKITRSLLEYKEVCSLFKTAFPKNERLPMFIMLHLLKRDGFNFRAFYDDSQFCGICYTIEDEKYIFVLYLAVNDNIRSKGYDSRIIQYIKSDLSKIVIILNAEPVDPNADNAQQREKRVEFYRKNGITDSGYIIEQGKNRFSILSSDNKHFSKSGVIELCELKFGKTVGKLAQKALHKV